MTIAGVNVSGLKSFKNLVIGNPQAKASLVQDPAFVATLIDCLDATSRDGTMNQDAVRIEAAHVVASLALGSDTALLALLRAQTPRALLIALSRLPSSNIHHQLRPSLARALRAIASSAADVVGPALWGLRNEPQSEVASLKEEAARAIDGIVCSEALDLYLPLLQIPSPSSSSTPTPTLSSPSPSAIGSSTASYSHTSSHPVSKPAQTAAHLSTATSIAQMLSSLLRTPTQRALVTEWMPSSPTSPVATAAAAPRSKRGWEKTAQPGVGAAPIVAKWLVVLLGGAVEKGRDYKFVEAILLALAALVKENPVVAGYLGRTDANPLHTIMTFAKSRSADVQVAACLCITHTLRSLPPGPVTPAPSHFPTHSHSLSHSSHPSYPSHPSHPSHPHSSHSHSQSHSSHSSHPLPYIHPNAPQTTSGPTSSHGHLGSPSIGGGTSYPAHPPHLGAGASSILGGGGGGGSASGASGASAGGGSGGSGSGSGGASSYTTPGLTMEATGVRTVLNVVNRMLSPATGESEGVKMRACFVLHYLVADDAQLCNIAFDQGCLDVLGALIQSISPSEPAPVEWEEGESSGVQGLREASLTALASLSMSSDDIRRRISSPPLLLLPSIARALRSSKHVGTRYAACQCVRAMGRSVSVLRTSVVDSGLGMDVFWVVMGRELGVKGGTGNGGKDKEKERERGGTGKEEGDKDSMDVEVDGGGTGKTKGLGEDRRVVGAALSAVCNIVNDFSPLRPTYLQEGLMPRLVYIIRESGDAPLRLNAIWAVKNLVRKASAETMRDVMSHFGWSELNTYFRDPDTGFQEQAFNLLQNLAEYEEGISMIFRELGSSVLTSLAHGIISSSPDVAFHAASALSNLANGTRDHQEQITSHPDLFRALASAIDGGPLIVRAPCVSCVLALARGQPRRKKAMAEAGIVGTLKKLVEWSRLAPAGGAGYYGHGHGHGGGGGGGGLSVSPTTARASAWGGRAGAGAGTGAWTPGTWSGGSVMHSALGAHVGAGAFGYGGGGGGARGHIGMEDDRDVVANAREALGWLENGETYRS